LQRRAANVAQIELRSRSQAELEDQRAEEIKARARILPEETFGDQALQDAMHGGALEAGIFHQVREADPGVASGSDQPDHHRGALDGLCAGGLVRLRRLPGFRFLFLHAWNEKSIIWNLYSRRSGSSPAGRARILIEDGYPRTESPRCRPIAA